VKGQDVYFDEPTVFEFPNMTVRVFRPVLTDEERARRMNEIKKAAVDLVLSREKAKGGIRA
jgi:hypothetical protein